MNKKERAESAFVILKQANERFGLPSMFRVHLVRELCERDNIHYSTAYRAVQLMMEKYKHCVTGEYGSILIYHPDEDKS